MLSIYVVQPGDTLWGLSRQFEVSLDVLAGLNDPPYLDRLTPGQALLVPAGQPQPAGRYVVQPGDTLYKISQKFGVPLQAIIQSNNIANPDLILPGQVLVVPAQAGGYPAIVNGYLPVEGEPERPTRGMPDVQAIRKAAPALTYVAIFSYAVKADGTLDPAADEVALATARSEGVEPLMTLTNYGARGFTASLAHATLTDAAVQDSVVQAVLDLLLSKGYRGLNIDFEYVPTQDREAYNAFMSRLADLLHPYGLLLSSALAPKTSATQPGELYEAHDYAAHGRLADFVMLMTYEWGWVGGPPLAIAPIQNVRRVLDYAVTAIPREKILMGMPNYARDWRIPWQQGTRAATITVQDAVKLAIDHGVPIEYDVAAQTPFFRYVDASGQAHEVWLEDARSVEEKIRTAAEYALAGVSIWEISAPFPQLAPLLADRFAVRKGV